MFTFRHHALILVLAGFFAVGCASKKEEVKPEDSVANAADADVNLSGDSDTGKAGGLQSINFPYDSFVLDTDAKAKLDQNAQIMKDKASLYVQIEGHCDERGGIQYNIALGEKRANAVRNYLIDKGIKADRLSTISFGKERPIDPGHSEAAWARNRRANFVITSK